MPGLTPAAVLAAYRQGIFPSGDEAGRIRWYSPDPRGILPLDAFRVPRSVRQARKHFTVTMDRAFEAVIDGCADRPTTWITPAIREAYVALHRQGHAHSVEAWQEGVLAGGVYGVHIGAAMMAESMFHRRSNAGKVALVALLEHLRRLGFLLCDIQMVTPATACFGAIEIPASEYLRRLQAALRVSVEWSGIPGAPP